MTGVDKIYIPVTIIIAFSLIVCLLVCSATLWTSKMRSKGFNLYLAGLLLPDIILNISAFIINCIQFAEDKYIEEISLNGCTFISSVVSYYLLANMWTSALICSEVHMLLVKSYKAERFTPSKPLTVIKRVAFVNFLACVTVITIYLILPPFGIDPGDSVCLEIPTRETDIVIQFIKFFASVPLLYICYVTFDVYWRKLLPPRGKSRFVATFFLRTAIISTILTIVTIVATSIRDGITFKVINFVYHGQGLLVGGMSMMKPDVRKMIWQILCCKKSADESTKNTTYGPNDQNPNSTTVQSMKGKLESTEVKSKLEVPSGQHPSFVKFGKCDTIKENTLILNVGQENK